MPRHETVLREDVDPGHRTQDAILDLLDNCVDGILRRPLRHSKSRSRKTRPYEGASRARIDARPDHFEIVDNCGGIDRQIAKDMLSCWAGLTSA